MADAFTQFHTAQYLATVIHNKGGDVQFTHKAFVTMAACFAVEISGLTKSYNEWKYKMSDRNGIGLLRNSLAHCFIHPLHDNCNEWD